MSDETPLKKYYVTGGRTGPDTWRDDVTVPPLVCYGKDRVDALTNSGITVWDAEEYEVLREQHPQFKVQP